MHIYVVLPCFMVIWLPFSIFNWTANFLITGTIFFLTSTKYSQSLLFADSFHICKFICNSKINMHGTCTRIQRYVYVQSGKVAYCLMHMLPVKVKQGNPRLSCFSSHTRNKCSFCSLLSVPFFALLCFLLVIFQFKIAPKHSA